jgi:hypothetical protein
MRWKKKMSSVGCIRADWEFGLQGPAESASLQREAGGEVWPLAARRKPQNG